MARTSPQDEISFRALEWADEMISQWLEVNESAQQIQRTLPPTVVAILPRDWSMNPYGLAMTVHPDLVVEGHALLESARSTIRAIRNGSLSHPVVTLDAKTDAETTGAGVGEGQDRRVAELEERVRHVEAERDGLALALRMIRTAADSALSHPGHCDTGP